MDNPQCPALFFIQSPVFLLNHLSLQTMQKKICLSLTLVLAWLLPLHAQHLEMDRIIAVVGNEIILESELEEQFQGEKSNNPDLPETARCAIFYYMLEQQILIAQADRDSVIVTDDEVETELEQRVRFWLGQAGSVEVLERASGRSLSQMKEDFRPMVRNKAIADRMKAQLLLNVKVTPSEVRAFYEAIPADSLPPVPATVEMGQVVIFPEVSEEIEALAREKLEDMAKEIKGGRSFSTMASIYSMDAGTKNDGGLLTNVSRKGLDPQFAAAAFRLQPGEISPVVKSSFGFHLIKMEQRRGEVADIRHILIIPEVTSVSLEETKKVLDSVYTKLVSKELSFQEAVSKYSNDDQSKMTGGMVVDMQSGNTLLTIDLIQDRQIAAAVTALEVGEYAKPHVFIDPATGKKGVRILYLKTRTPPHKLNLQDDYNTIQEVATNKKQVEFIKDWMKKEASAYYISVDPEYQQCAELEVLNLQFSAK